MQARARYHKGEHKSSPWSGPWVEVQARVMSQPSKDSSAAGTRNSETPNSSVPSAPNLMGAAVTPAGQVLLSWLNPADDSITGYQVLRGPDAAALVVIEQDTGSSGTSYTDTAPPAGQTHTYAVKARNAAGLSPLSNTATATVPAAEDEEEELVTAQQNSDAVLVSNLGQTDEGTARVFDTFKGAQSFVAGPHLADSGYRFEGIRVSARPDGSGTDLYIPEVVRVSLHSDDSGLPGSRLHTLTVPDGFVRTGGFSDYTLSAPPGTILPGGVRYWVVFEVPLTQTLILRTTSSTAEDQTPPPVSGWLIDNQSYEYDSDVGAPVWVSAARPIKLAVLGSSDWVTDEPAGEDFPGADFNAHETRGLVTPGTVSNGHMTAGVDRNYGQTGDYWYLDTQPGHSYRVEVTFGASPNNNTVGSVGVEFIDPDHDNYPDASGCCESDHNRDDGHTFVHFTHSRQSREWNTSYLLHVAAYDQLNTNSRIYNGPYTIQMTDITGTREFVSNLYQDTRTNLLEVGAARQYAMFFETGYNAAGYKLDRIQTFITHGGSPQFSLYSNTSNAPGTKLCDFRNPSKVQHHVVWSAGIPATTFLATDCAEITLMPTDSSGTLHTYYWIVMEGTNYRPSGMDSNGESAYEPGWRIGDLAVTKTTASWLGVGNSKTIPIGVWARERHNPLSVSQEVTSDPTRGMDSDTYGAGDVITFEVKFSEPVTITGAPRLRFKVSGAGDDYAPYVSGSGSNTLVFAYTVLATETDTNGIFLYNRPLSYPDAAVDTIVAVDDNLPVFDNITGQLITLSGHKIDGTITN